MIISNLIKPIEYPFQECPECDSKVEFYNDDIDGKGGQYRCPNCGRDTFWRTGQAESIFDILSKLK